MKNQKDNPAPHLHDAQSEFNDMMPASLHYPPTQDIYNRGILEPDVDPENTSRLKTPNDTDTADTANEKDFEGNVSGADLDIPGSERDEAEENEGNEDEENNYYSLGGDDHNDLDENPGDIVS